MINVVGLEKNYVINTTMLEIKIYEVYDKNANIKYHDQICSTWWNIYLV